MKTGERLYLGLLGIGLLLGTALALSLGGMLSGSASPGARVVLLAATALLTVMILLAGVGLGLLGLTLVRQRPVSNGSTVLLRMLDLLLPLAVRLGQLLGRDKRTVECSFIELNNRLVRLTAPVVTADRLLILAPHCLQNSECTHKITVDVRNCRRCGGCSVQALRELSDRYGCRLAVATGGTLARQFVTRVRPQAIVAIACERDLASGITDSAPLPVLGVLNDRPHGPCLNTQVEIDRVTEAIEYLTGGGKQDANVYRQFLHSPGPAGPGAGDVRPDEGEQYLRPLPPRTGPLSSDRGPGGPASAG